MGGRVWLGGAVVGFVVVVVLGGEVGGEVGISVLRRDGFSGWRTGDC